MAKDVKIEVIKEKAIKIPIYHSTLKIIVGDFHQVHKKYGFDDDPEKYDAFVWVAEKDGYIVYHVAFRGADPKPSLVAHEATHIMTRVFRDRGIRLDPFNDEPMAYFMGWIVEEIHKFLKSINAETTKSTGSLPVSVQPTGGDISEGTPI